MFLDLKHKVLNKEVSVILDQVFTIYEDEKGATRVVSTAGAFVPVAEPVSEVKDKIKAIKENKNEV